MKAIELLKINETPFKIAQMAGLRLDDCQYIGLFTEYSSLRAQGEKVTYIVSPLADKYQVSERKVYDFVKRMQTDCKVTAV